jgi:hypothetical protein
LKRAEHAEAEAVVDQGDVILPGELDEGAAPGCEPFAEVVLRKGGVLQDLPSFEVHHAQRRLALETGAFIQMAVEIDQALCKCALVVRIGVDDLVGVVRDGRRDGCDREGKDKEDAAVGDPPPGEHQFVPR